MSESRRYVNDEGDTINETVMKCENIVDAAIREKALACVRLAPENLNQDQLEYEIALRESMEAEGGPLDGNQRYRPVVRLTKMLAEDKKENRKITHWPKEFTSDEWKAELEHCRQAVDELTNDMQRVGEDFLKRSVTWETLHQIGTLITHYYGRWSRLNMGMEPYEYDEDVRRLLNDLENHTAVLSKIYTLKLSAQTSAGDSTNDTSRSTNTEDPIAPELSSTHKEAPRLETIGNTTEAVQDISDWSDRVEALRQRIPLIIADGEPQQQLEKFDMLTCDISAFHQTIETAKDKFNDSIRKEADDVGLRLKGLKFEVSEQRNIILYQMEKAKREREKEWRDAHQCALAKLRELLDRLWQIERAMERRINAGEIETSRLTLEIGGELDEMATEIQLLLENRLDPTIREKVIELSTKCRVHQSQEKARKRTGPRADTQEKPTGKELDDVIDRFAEFASGMAHNIDPQGAKKSSDQADFVDLTKTIEEREHAKRNEEQGRRVQMQPPSNGSVLNGSKLWPRANTRDGPPPLNYHPCTPYHEPEYDDIADETVGKRNDMNSHHKQQYLKHVMGNRRFDGEQKGDKSFTIDEYIETLKRYKEATEATDTEVLKQQYLYMTGKAHTWWLSHEPDVRTISELDIRLRARFGAVFISPMQRLAQFTQRKQKEGEHLLDYMDDKRALARKLDQPLDEQTIIQEVVNNAQWKYRSHLAARRYESLNALSRQMEYLSQGEDTKALAKLNRPMAKPAYGYKTNKSVNATETESVLGEEERAEDEKKTDDASMVMDVLVDLVEKYTKQQPQRQSRNVMNQKSASVGMEANSAEEKDIEALTSFRCYGCSTPGVIRKNCSKCQGADQSSKNE